MSTEEQIKNPHVILDEIAKRLNRIAGGTKVFSLHNAINLAKEDTTKFFECLTFIKTNITKFSQPTAGGHQTVLSIVELIDEFSGSLSLEDLELISSKHLVSTETTEEADETDETDETADGTSCVVTQELLDEHPELATIVNIGDIISFTDSSDTIEFTVTQSFIDAHPELNSEIEIDDVIQFTKVDDSDDFDQLMNDSEETEELSKQLSTKEDIIKDEFKSSEKTVSLTEALSKINVDQPATPIGNLLDQVIPADENIKVKASKTFDGKKTKVTKKLLSTYKILEGLVIAGDFIYVDGDKLTAMVVSNPDHAAENKVNIGDLIIFDKPLLLE